MYIKIANFYLYGIKIIRKALRNNITIMIYLLMAHSATMVQQTSQYVVLRSAFNRHTYSGRYKIHYLLYIYIRF